MKIERKHIKVKKDESIFDAVNRSLKGKQGNIIYIKFFKAHHPAQPDVAEVVYQVEGQDDD
jgi:hypothetical protein